MLKFSETRKIQSIHAGFNMSAIICSSDNNFDTIYTFGETSNSQLGYNHAFVEQLHYWALPTEVTYFTENNLSVLNVAFSEYHTLFLVKYYVKNIKKVYACGLNNHNQCGQTFRGKVIVVPEIIELDFDVSMIAAGKKESLFLNEEGQMFLVGKNNHLVTEVKEFEKTPSEKFKKICTVSDNFIILTAIFIKIKI